MCTPGGSRHMFTSTPQNQDNELRALQRPQHPEPRGLVARQKWIGRNLAGQKEQSMKAAVLSSLGLCLVMRIFQGQQRRPVMY